MTTGKYYQTRRLSGELDGLRIIMLTRGLTYRDIAQRIGRTPQQVANVLSGDNKTWPIRAEINSALRIKIFSKAGRSRHQTIAKKSKKTNQGTP